MEFTHAINSASAVSDETLQTMHDEFVNNIDSITSNIKTAMQHDAMTNKNSAHGIVVNEDGLIRITKAETNSNVFYIAGSFVTIAKKARLSISIVPRCDDIEKEADIIKDTLITMCVNECLTRGGEGDFYKAL